LALAASALALAWGPITAEPAESTSCENAVREFCNDRSPFFVRVDVDRRDRVYEEGEEVLITVESEKQGYLYLIYCAANGRVHCLFPNKYQTTNPVPAGKRIVVPSADAEFALRVRAPYGGETLTAVVSLEELPFDKHGIPTLTDESATPLTAVIVKDIAVEMKKKPATFAAHQVEVTTVQTRKGKPPAPKPRRIALIVGINHYGTDAVRALTVADKDALRVQEVLNRFGRMDEVHILINEQATREHIQTAICQTLVEKTRPGDEVFIYWSGHGGRCGDTGGDEADGLDEYLTPFGCNMDSLQTIQQSVITDDVLGHWLQKLDGRRVAIVLDTCYAGGFHQGEKEVPPPDPTPDAPFDFLQGEVVRTKEIGQEGVIVLCCSLGSQKGFERIEGDLSTMTYYLVELLESGIPPISVADAYHGIKGQVEDYVMKHFYQEQTPVLFGAESLSEPIYLRP
jgi:hypothetical protein